MVMYRIARQAGDRRRVKAEDIAVRRGAPTPVQHERVQLRGPNRAGRVRTRRVEGEEEGLVGTRIVLHHRDRYTTLPHEAHVEDLDPVERIGSAARGRSSEDPRAELHLPQPHRAPRNEEEAAPARRVLVVEQGVGRAVRHLDAVDGHQRRGRPEARSVEDRYGRTVGREHPRVVGCRFGAELLAEGIGRFELVHGLRSLEERNAQQTEDGREHGSAVERRERGPQGG